VLPEDFNFHCIHRYAIFHNQSRNLNFPKLMTVNSLRKELLNIHLSENLYKTTVNFILEKLCCYLILIFVFVFLGTLLCIIEYQIYRYFC